MDARRKVIEILEEERLFFGPEEIWYVVRREGIKVDGDPNAFIEDVMAEGVGRSLEVAEKLLGALGIRSLPPEVEERLQKGEIVQVCFYEKGNATFLVGNDRRIEKFLDFPLPRGHETPLGVGVDIGLGLAVLRVEDNLEAVRGRAFFKGYSEEALERVLDRLKPLAPLLSFMELEDLPQALERLRMLDTQESRLEGPYVLVRGVGVWLLRRGPIFGDPELDGALLREEEVTVTFPEDVKISFSFLFETDMALITHLEVAWRGEVVQFDEILNGGRRFPTRPLDRDFVAGAIRDLLGYGLSLLEERNVPHLPREDPPLCLKEASSRMLALLRVLAYHEDPFNILAEGKVSHYVTTELFNEL